MINMKNEDFYIGYYPKASKYTTKTIRKVVLAIFAILLIAIFTITYFEKGFIESQFEYGKLTTIEGVLYKNPVPMLRVFMGKKANGENLYKSILLVNFQKFGAGNLLLEYTKKGVCESESLVKLRGTLIYHDGVTVMELTEQEDAILGFSISNCGKGISKPAIPLIEVKKLDFPNDLRQEKNLGNISFAGEIIDPKCFFGAMKPGEGKPHRDCAIRCISGGIPPIFFIKSSTGEVNYILLTDEKGESINNKILKFVGSPIELEGKLIKIDEWFVLKVSQIK
jgi:hypothetical protein